jgi:serine/threonine protein kinase
LFLFFVFCFLFRHQSSLTVIGTPPYMAPEAFEGHPCPASDYYSVGGTLLFCLTGKPTPPFFAQVLQAKGKEKRGGKGY